MDPSKERCRSCYDRWDVYVLGRTDLALMTGFDKPCHVTVNSWPPEAIHQGAPSRVEPLMAKLVMHLQNEGKMLCRRKYNELMDYSRTLSPKLVIAHKESSGMFNKLLQHGVVKIGRLLGCS